MTFSTNHSLVSIVCGSALVWSIVTDRTYAVEIVRDGQSIATIVVENTANEESARRAGAARTRTRQKRHAKQRRRDGFSSDADAANVIVEWVRKITGATLPVSDAAPKNGPAIFVGSAAVRAGLKIDDIESPSREGLRVVVKPNRILLAGQSTNATVRGACRLLEQMGCRFFMDGPLGEVYPKSSTLRIEPLELTEKPTMHYRKIWGSNWSGNGLWKIWNGAGGIEADTRHAWGAYVPKALFDTHPEYFAQRHGERRASDWYCTSNRGLRQVFADNVISAINAGDRSPSISPPDGRGYCECDACRAEDDPKSLEPSSGVISVTNRYVDFFNDIARRVALVHPQAVLNFYVYADYTQPPTGGVRLEPNLCVWLAPIRYCRIHAIGAANCPSRTQLSEMIDRWAGCAQRVGYRTYNYNLAECLVPFSLASVWQHDIPYLRSKGCTGINLETLPSWHIYGPHIYLSIRLAYDANADAAAIMNDYYEKFYGPAAEAMQKYWAAVDEAFKDLDCHSGGFSAVHLVYTQAFLARCDQFLQRAHDAAAAPQDSAYAKRIDMAGQGLNNAVQYRKLFDSINAGDFIGAKRIADELISRTEQQVAAGYASHYTSRYFRRFVAQRVDAMAAATAPPAKLLSILPDMWKLAYDEADVGITRGYAAADVDDSKWRKVATFSRTLDAQGLLDNKTILWYRNEFQVPDHVKGLRLIFMDVDGGATVFINGQQVGGEHPKRQLFEVDVSPLVRAGRNVVAMRIDHRAISELFLGGIVRPVALVKRPAHN
jgi:Domain of unknown function (DUF4838)/Glycosyl hydrolases family 2, sugar binding domain